jgi:hypothetical protein
MKNKIKIGDEVKHLMYENEPFKVLGISKNKVKLKGDWSGGTHHTVGSAWVNKSEIR